MVCKSGNWDFTMVKTLDFWAFLVGLLFDVWFWNVSGTSTVSRRRLLRKLLGTWEGFWSACTQAHSLQRTCDVKQGSVEKFALRQCSWELTRSHPKEQQLYGDLILPTKHLIIMDHGFICQKLKDSRAHTQTFETYRCLIRQREVQEKLGWTLEGAVQHCTQPRTTP